MWKAFFILSCSSSTFFCNKADVTNGMPWARILSYSFVTSNRVEEENGAKNHYRIRVESIGNSIYDANQNYAKLNWERRNAREKLRLLPHGACLPEPIFRYFCAFPFVYVCHCRCISGPLEACVSGWKSFSWLRYPLVRNWADSHPKLYSHILKLSIQTVQVPKISFPLSSSSSNFRVYNF